MESHSQVGQDLFVVSCFPEGHKGFFVDIGCQLPDKINNTLLLEELGWDGVSIDFVDYFEEWKSRKTRFICADALRLNYAELNIPPVVDYLSIDINAYAGARFHALQLFLSYGFEFKVLTIEHEMYLGYYTREAIPQRELLKEKGYLPYKLNVCNNDLPYEDWHYNPKYLNLEV